MAIFTAINTLFFFNYTPRFVLCHVQPTEPFGDFEWPGAQLGFDRSLTRHNDSCQRYQGGLLLCRSRNLRSYCGSPPPLHLNLLLFFVQMIVEPRYATFLYSQGACTCFTGYDTSNGQGSAGTRGDCGYSTSFITACPVCLHVALRLLLAPLTTPSNCRVMLLAVRTACVVDRQRISASVPTGGWEETAQNVCPCFVCFGVCVWFH